MKQIVFECQKCGNCCRNLIEKGVDGVTNGLILTSKEIRLFPRKLVSPFITLGKKKPEKIIFFQLNTSVCPHLSENNECMKYEKRPLTCKAFPIETTQFGRIVSRRCYVIRSEIGELEECEVEYPNGFEASDKRHRYLLNRCQKYYKSGMNIWKFDLKTKKWVRARTKAHA